MSTLLDSEDKIIERLGDCDKVPVEYIDLVNHRIRCRKIEIFHYEDSVSFTANEEEEEEEQGLSYDQLYSEDHTDDEDRTLQLVGDLDCLVRRIEQMQMIIKQRKQQQLQLEVSEVSSEQLEEQDEEQQEKHDKKQKQKEQQDQHQLSCDEQLEVRNLQHAHHRLQCEIDELVCNYRMMRDLLRKMRDQLCLENRRLRKLATMTHQYQEWSVLVAEELSICKQRYQRLLENKLCKAEALCVINTHKSRAFNRSRNYLTNRQLNYELREFHAEIDELIEYADDLRKEMVRRFASIEPETQHQHEPSVCCKPSSARM